MGGIDIHNFDPSFHSAFWGAAKTKMVFRPPSTKVFTCKPDQISTLYVWDRAGPAFVVCCSVADSMSYTDEWEAFPRTARDQARSTSSASARPECNLESELAVLNKMRAQLSSRQMHFFPTPFFRSDLTTKCNFGIIESITIRKGSSKIANIIVVYC